jgi:hypothetical protein
MSENNDGVQFYYNVVYVNNLIGIYATTSSSGGTFNHRIYNNTSYNNTITNLHIGGVYPQVSNGCLNNRVTNNILSGTTPNMRVWFGCENAAPYGNGNVYTYNNLGAQGAGFMQWGANRNLASYAAFDAAYGSSTHSATGDPNFTNAAGNDFTLLSDSPAVGAGTDLGIPYHMGLDLT